MSEQTIAEYFEELCKEAEANPINKRFQAESDLRCLYMQAVEKVYQGDSRWIKDAKQNWTIFKRYLPEIRAAILRYSQGRLEKCHSLTQTAWHVAGSVYNRGDGLQLMDFNERSQRCYLRRGLMELCKILIREFDR